MNELDDPTNLKAEVAAMRAVVTTLIQAESTLQARAWERVKHLAKSLAPDDADALKKAAEVLING